MGLVRPPFSVADPGEPPHHFSRTPPILRVWMTAPLPPLSEGLDPPMILEFATNGILALIPFKIGKLSSFLGCVP